MDSVITILSSSYTIISTPFRQGVLVGGNALHRPLPSYPCLPDEVGGRGFPLGLEGSQIAVGRTVGIRLGSDCRLCERL